MNTVGWFVAVTALAMLIVWHVRQMIDHRELMTDLRVRRQMRVEFDTEKLQLLKSLRPGLFDECETWEHAIARMIER